MAADTTSYRDMEMGLPPAAQAARSGGHPSTVGLDQLLGEPMAIERFLRIATAATAALAEVHRIGVLHASIKPESLTVQEATDEVTLSGFGLEGTLAYIAPEQTGRTNYSVDQRADLYSLGITFYQMLTGELPFVAKDPLEWVHCHLARAPRRMRELVPDLPEALCNVIDKLLAKTPDERYQSAAGLKLDLDICLRQWKAQGHIQPFALAQRDYADRLCIPKQLYGRRLELQALKEAFARVVATGAPELILISGAAGVGKSSLVNELRKQLVSEQALFLAGKYDQARRASHSTIVDAFREPILDMLAASDASLRAFRRRLLEALGPNGQLVIDLIPQLELILGKQPPVVELGPSEAQLRFGRVAQRFIGAFAEIGRPVVLFLDDLQWADGGSLNLLRQILCNPEARHLLVIGAYRDNELAEGHALAPTVQEIRGAGVAVHELEPRPLSPADLTALIADSGLQRAASLAQLIHQRTRGNPLFALQFLTSLHQERLLTLDRNANQWRWDAAKIAARAFSEDLIEFVVGKLQALPADSLELLELAACVGCECEAELLATLCERTGAEVHARLHWAVDDALVWRHGTTYRFAHERVRQAAYSLLSPSERAPLHLRIGRLLFARSDLAESPELVLDIVNQFNRAASLVSDEDERVRVAALNLTAARRAKHVDVAAAREYVGTALALLGEQRWERHGELAFTLELERAECEYAASHLEEAARLLAQLAERRLGKRDAATVFRLKMQVHLASGQIDDAVQCAVRALARFDIVLPERPTAQEVAAERAHVRRLLGDRTIEQLIDLPPMTDEDAEAALQIEAPSYFTDPNQYVIHVARLLQLCIERGNADASVLWYGYYGLCLASFFGEYEDAYRYAKLACDLAEQRGIVRYRGRALYYLAWVSFWSRPLEEKITHTLASLRAALESGELVGASHLYAQLPLALLAKSDPLPEVLAQADGNLEQLRALRMQDMADVVIAIRQMIKNLQGRTRDFSTFSDESFDETGFEASLRGRLSTLVCHYWIFQLRARCLFGQYAAAARATEEAAVHLYACAGLVAYRDFYFYGALTLAARAADAPAEARLKLGQTLTAYHRQLGSFAASFPSGFHHQFALVGAEIARLEGREVEAERLYEESLAWAKAGKFVGDEALAHELAASFYRARGLDAFADLYLGNAHAGYLRWGATGKAAQLERLHPALAIGSPPFGQAAPYAGAQHIDLLSVMKASQAIGSELELDNLVGTLLEIVLTQSGAQKAFLIAPSDELAIQAEATVDGSAVAVHAHAAEPVASAGRVPRSLLRYVLRTGESVVLDDAAARSRFSDDEYLARVRPRALLCRPVKRQGSLLALLYLENDVSPSAFTSAQLAVLESLAAQAAMSLENARLYRESLAAAQRRDEFIRAASHELNTPMTALMLNLQSVQRRAEDVGFADPSFLRMMHLAERQGWRLTHLISDLLELVRMEDGPLALHCETVELTAVVNQVVSDHAPELKRAGCEVRFWFAGPVRGRWDARLIEQVVHNLVRNATKFGAGHAIEVRVEQRDNRGRLSIADHGIGIDAAAHARIFQRFERGLSVEQYGGLGLGLYACRRIVEAHQGTIHVESEVGHGATFVVELPCLTVKGC
jgi:predicted ATPase/signal transduction histidine kinase